MMKMILPMIISSLTFKSQLMFFLSMCLTLLFWLASYPFSIYWNLWNSFLMSDSLSFSLILLTMFSFLLISVSSLNLKPSFYLLFMISILLMLSFSSSNFILFFISFEAVIIPTFILVSVKGNYPERIQASSYLIIYTIFGSLPLLLGLVMFKDFTQMLLSKNLSLTFSMPLMFIMAFLIKMPMFFSHLWLPKAHVEAPMEGSMILAAVLLKLGGYGLIRIFPMIQSNQMWFSSMIIALSILGSSMTSLNCLQQKDLKALIAYSSVAHMSLVISAIFSLKLIGLLAATIMMVAHGMTSSALFFLVTIMFLHNHSRNILLFKGILVVFPNLTLWLFLFSALNISAPPSINMISETLIFASINQLNLLTPVLILFSSLFVASFSFLLFSNLTHNNNPIYPAVSQSNPKMFLSLLTHLFPVIFLSLKTEIFTWNMLNLSFLHYFYK